MDRQRGVEFGQRQLKLVGAVMRVSALDMREFLIALVQQFEKPRIVSGERSRMPLLGKEALAAIRAED
jgi:hypothetical protein